MAETGIEPETLRFLCKTLHLIEPPKQNDSDDKKCETYHCSKYRTMICLHSHSCMFVLYVYASDGCFSKAANCYKNANLAPKATGVTMTPSNGGPRAPTRGLDYYNKE